MYDGTDFVQRLLRDPRDSLAVTTTTTTGPTPSRYRRRSRRHRPDGCAWPPTSWCTPKLRKLYQPSHNRFYVVVAEVLCDQPGLPRAGQHDDFDVAFVMRRHRTSVTGERRPTRRLARQLMLDLARAQTASSVDDDRPAARRTCETCGGPITCGTSSSNRTTAT